MWEVEYPVNFTSGGDRTRDAFAKHISEIDKVYSHLNELNESKQESFDDDILAALEAANSPERNNYVPFVMIFADDIKIIK